MLKLLLELTKNLKFASMTNAEKDLIDEKFHGLTSLINARFENFEESLTRIEAQTTKTNGRVTELEKKNIVHYANCPNNPTIESIKNGFFYWFNTPFRMVLFFLLIIFVVKIFDSDFLWGIIKKLLEIV